MTDDLVLGLGGIPSPPDDRDYPVSALYEALAIEPPVALPTSFFVAV